MAQSAVRERLVAALDRWLRQEQLPWVREVLRGADPDEYRGAVRDALLAQDMDKVAELGGQARAAEQPPGFVALLSESGALTQERSRELLRVAVGQRPGDLGLLMALGRTYPAIPIYATKSKEGIEERLRWYQAAVGVAPKNSAAHNSLGIALRAKGQVKEAIACYKRAIALNPKHANAHSNLCYALVYEKGQLEEAIASGRTAIALAPKDFMAHTNLGAALDLKGQREEAIACYKRAIALNPKNAMAYYNLGNTLRDKGQQEEAIASYRTAIKLDPKHSWAHNMLGAALQQKGELEEAIVCIKQAIALAPNLASAHTNLGIALYYKGELDAAIACHKQAIALAPKYAIAHGNLGQTLYDQGQLEEAIVSFRTAVALEPKLANVRAGLGKALLDTGRFVEARDALARALEQLPKQHPLRSVVSQQLQTCERFLKLEGRLPRLLKGEDQPATALESLAVARLCQLKRLHAAAERFFAAAFADNPKLAGNLPAQHRYDAARAAALAAAGQGEDAGKLDDTEKARLRKQALDWLRADLAAHAKLVASGPVSARPFVLRTLVRWEQDSDLAGLRNPAALNKLAAEERTALTQLWADVAALQKQAEQLTGKMLGQVYEVGKGLRLQGQLDAQTPALRYQVKLLADKTYVIDMVSPDQKALDPYLRLFDAAGKKLAEDDDSGGGLNARIVFRSQQDGTYRIEASSFNVGRGAFTLTVREQAEKTKEEKQLADEIAKHQQALARLKAGKRELALPLLVEVVKLRKARLGPDHAETLNSLNQLGVVYWQLRQLDRSIPVFEEVLKARQAKDGANHPDTLLAKANLGVSYKDAGRFKEALPLLEAAHRGSPKVPQLTWVVLPLLEAYTLAGEHAKLAQLLPEAVPVAQAAAQGQSAVGGRARPGRHGVAAPAALGRCRTVVAREFGPPRKDPAGGLDDGQHTVDAGRGAAGPEEVRGRRTVAAQGVRGHEAAAGANSAARAGASGRGGRAAGALVRGVGPARRRRPVDQGTQGAQAVAEARGENAMNQAHDPQRTTDKPPTPPGAELHDDNRTVDEPSAPADALDAGLAAAFGPAAAPRSSLARRSDRCYSRKPRARAPTSSSRTPTPCRRRSRPGTATNSLARSPAAAWARYCAAVTWTWAATWPSRSCWRSTPTAPRWCAASWKRRRSAASCSTPASCPSTTSAASASARSSP